MSTCIIQRGRDKMNRLRGLRVMLSGGMDLVADHGASWRNELKPWLWSKGCGVFDPCDKPIDKGEEIESKVMRDNLIDKKDWRTLKATMKTIRQIDLRMVTLSDVVVVYLSREEKTCGTWEELNVACMQNKPTIIIYKEGRKNVPHWLVAQVPTQLIFGSFGEAKKYLTHIDEDEVIDDLGRWIFFDFNKLYKENI
jgi:hypothetical protein